MSTYFAILTEVGEAKLANAIALGQTLKLKTMAVGDGNGNLPLPVRTQKALVREVRRAGLNQLTVDPANASQIIVEQVLPEDVGGWWIREIGIYDEAGDLCAVANCPPSYKPLMAEGSGRTQVVRIVLIVASTAAIELKIDPSIILATRKYVDDQDIIVRAFSDAQLAKHLAADDPHPLLAKVRYVDQQDANVMRYTDQQVANHLVTDDPHPQLAKVRYVDQQDANLMRYTDQQLANHLATDDPHPQLAKADYVNQQDASVIRYGNQQLVNHMIDENPHPLLAKLAYVDQQDASARAYGEQQLAAHLDAADPHTQYSMKEVATLPKFDASKKLANAAFVQQSQGSFVQCGAVIESRNLTVHDIGCALYFPFPGMTLTMSSPVSLGIQSNTGKCVKIFGFKDIGTIVGTQDAVIGFGGVIVPSVAIKSGQSITLMATGDHGWDVIDSTADMVRNADFSALLAVNGYQKLAGGMIIQKGQVLTNSAADFVRFYFPIQFPRTDQPTVFVSPINGGALTYTAWHNSPTASYVDVKANEPSIYIDVLAIGY